MKKGMNILTYLLFAVLYACCFSLGMAGLLHYLGSIMAVSLDSGSVVQQYPRFVPFCIVVGIFSLAALVFLAVLNIKNSEKLNYNKPVWIAQSIGAFVISVPMMKMWELLFEALQKAL